MATIALYIIVIYAIAIAVGGGIGFLKSKSKVSLISGLGSAALLVVARVVANQNVKAGLAIALATAIALVAVFGMRLRKTGKFMPAGMLAIVSGLAAVAFAIGVLHS